VENICNGKFLKVMQTYRKNLAPESKGVVRGLKKREL
jgi:hypothetical protein